MRVGLGLTPPRVRFDSCRPVKQRRALLESNPPRDSWIDGDEIENVGAFGEAETSPNGSSADSISEPEHAFLKLTIHLDEVAVNGLRGLGAGLAEARV